MAIVHETIQIEADPERVWELAGDPARIAEWVPALASATAEGGERRCTLEDGGELVERIIERPTRSGSTSTRSSTRPMPLRSYRSRLTVHGHDGHAHLDWVAEFEPQQPGHEEQLAEAFAATYRSGLEELRGRFEVGLRA